MPPGQYDDGSEHALDVLLVLPAGQKYPDIIHRTKPNNSTQSANDNNNQPTNQPTDQPADNVRNDNRNENHDENKGVRNQNINHSIYHNNYVIKTGCCIPGGHSASHGVVRAGTDENVPSAHGDRTPATQYCPGPHTLTPVRCVASAASGVE